MEGDEGAQQPPPAVERTLVCARGLRLRADYVVPREADAKLSAAAHLRHERVPLHGAPQEVGGARAAGGGAALLAREGPPPLRCVVVGRPGRRVRRGRAARLCVSDRG